MIRAGIFFDDKEVFCDFIFHAQNLTFHAQKGPNLLFFYKIKMTVFYKNVSAQMAENKIDKEEDGIYDW